MRGEESLALYARLDDLAARSERGEICRTPFLSPEEHAQASEHLTRTGMQRRKVEFGGYESAERRCIYLLPEYLEGVTSYYEIEECLDDGRIVSLSVRGSGYRTLTHRDYLGALMSLGVERQVLGDVVFESEDTSRAVVFCDAIIAKYISSELKKIANDAVSVCEIVLPRDFTPHRSFLHISDTVASERIDCVVASLCSLSREKARACVESELVQVDYRTCNRPDKDVCAPCIISVRGYGKFRISSLSEKTKKGRIRLSADKYL